jgi:hypothetical protein
LLPSVSALVVGWVFVMVSALVGLVLVMPSVPPTVSALVVGSVLVVAWVQPTVSVRVRAWGPDGYSYRHDPRDLILNR